MGERGLSKASVLCVVAMVVGAALLLFGGSGTQSPPTTTAPALTGEAAPVEVPSPPAPTSTHPPGGGGHDAYAHDEERTPGVTYPTRPPESVEALAAAIADPARSDLPAPLFHELSALGVAVLEADVTGRGRDRWPGYWPPGPYRPCCAAIKVHAAGARSEGGRPDRAVVRILWSAERLVGERIRPRETEVPLQLRNGVWGPA